MPSMDPMGALTIIREALSRLWPLMLVPLALGSSQAALAQVANDAAFNQAINPGAPRPAYTYGVDVGFGETDNVALTPTNRTSQTMALANVDFSVNRQSRLFDATAVGNFSYIDYLQGAFSPQFLGRFDGTATAEIIPGNLTWIFKDDFGQSTLDPYTPAAPGNTENINYFTTGPQLKLRFGGVDFIDVNLRYGRAQFQTSPFDSNRAFASIAVGRDVSAGGTMSLDAASERVMFADTDINGDFTLSSLFGRYELAGARNYFIGELGATTVSRDAASGAPVDTQGIAVRAAAGGSLTGPLLKLQLTRRISASNSLIFTAGQFLTDPASSFSIEGVGATGVYSTTPGYLTGGVYRDTYGSAGWRFQRNRTTVGLTGTWERDVYPGLPTLNSFTHGAEANVQRQMNRAWALQVFARWNAYHYPDAVLTQPTGSTQYTNTVAGGGVTWHHGRALEVRLRVEHGSYTANGNTGYHESRGFLTVGYRPFSSPPAQ
jgi:hypothetical protein